MMRQYFAQSCQGGDNPLRVGLIPIGAIFYLQHDWWWRDRYRGAPICRNPWIVEAFLNGTMAAARRNPDTGRWEDIYVARRSDIAIVRSLRDGRLRHIAIRTLTLHDHEGLTAGPVGYPSLPTLRNRGETTLTTNVSGSAKLDRDDPGTTSVKASGRNNSKSTSATHHDVGSNRQNIGRRRRA